MKGLLLKDCYLTWKYAKMLLLIPAAFLILSAFQPGNAFYMLYPSIMVAVVPVTLYSYDDREKWTVYAQALPVSRAQYVTEKYLFGALVLAVYLAVMTSLYLLVNKDGLSTALMLSPTFGLLGSAVMLPIMLRFGAEKGRIVYLVFLGALCGATTFLTLSKGVDTFSDAFPAPKWAPCLIALALYILSWRLSIVLYNKREL